MQQFIGIIFGVVTIYAFIEFRKEFVKLGVTIVQIVFEMMYNTTVRLTKIKKVKHEHQK